MDTKRTIKFRGKRIDNGEWVYGDLIHFPNGVAIVECDQFTVKSSLKVDPKTVGQFTGLPDKNKKEIYCDDIIINGDDRIKYIVEWIDNGLRARQISNKSTIGLSFWKSGFEIIGNIHEDSHLIK